MSSKITKTYQSYLLRCWTPQEMKPGDPPARRFMIEPISGEPHRRGFDTFEALVAFLRAELQEAEGADEIKQ